jgi:hypothetical protein
MYPFRILISLIVGFGLFFPARALAAAPHIPCRNPFVFSDAAVNVVVLPYDDTAVSEATSRNSGTQLALLIQMDALSHILRYGNVGAVQMEAPPGAGGDCNVNAVAAKLLAKEHGAQAQIQPEHGLVLVWGLMYEEDDDLYIQTYVRFLRRDISEDLVFSAGEYKFTAKPTSQAITFAPRHLSKRELDAIRATYAKSNVVHQQPNDSSPGEELHGVARCAGCPEILPLGFMVIGQNGDWIRIRRQLPNGESREGWIHARTNASQDFEVDHRLPELSFIEGAVGYLRSRVDAENKQEVSQERGRLAAQQFANFIALSDKDSESVAVAVAEQLSGIVHVLASKSYLEGLTGAQASFERARQLVPYSSDAITLSTATELNRAALAAASANQPIAISEPRLLAQRLAQASALAPASKEALANLSSFYKVALKAQQLGAPANRLERPEIEQQIQRIDPRLMMLPQSQTEQAPNTTNPPNAQILRKRLDLQELKIVDGTAIQRNPREN